MAFITPIHSGPRFRPGRATLVTVLCALGLVLFSLAYKNGFDYRCGPPAPTWFCVMASTGVPRAFGILVALCFFFLSRRATMAQPGAAPGRLRSGLGLAALGFAGMMAPWLVLSAQSSAASVIPAAIVGLSGVTLYFAGFAIALHSPETWFRLVRRNWPALVILSAIGAALPEAVNMLKGVWHHSETLKAVTFDAVLRLLDLWGYRVEANPVERIIGAGDFYVWVNQSCAGIEGFVLTTAFVSLYLVLFRDQLRFPRALLLFPVGLTVSWMFNVLRIAILLVIGLEGNPELAVGGFHSHAGWVMFTLVALLIILLAQGVPLLKKVPGPDISAAEGPSRVLPFLQDPVVARILPFAVFMLTALLASILSQTPGTLYPFRIVALGCVMALFLPIYARLPWSLDVVALGAGLTVGTMWVLVPQAGTGGALPYGALTGGTLILWFIMRGAGTILFVPLIEELFFRDYLENRLRIGTGQAWAIFAALVTAGLFAALHDRWAEAFVAGLVFSAVYRRRGRITDAILAHAVANALIFVVALGRGNLAII